MAIYLPLLVAILGLITYLAAKTNPELKELGRLSFFAGLLVTLFELATHVVRF